MMSEKKVAILVVSYNRKELLLECLNALLQQSFSNISIYIIDNASTDGTKDAIQIYLNKNFVNYYNTGSNLGGAGGFNYGMNIAVQTDCDYVWIMDDDTIPEPNALKELIKAAELLNDEFGFLSSYVKFTDGESCMMNRQLVPQRKWIEDYEFIKDGILRIERATFVSMFIKTSIIFQEGLPIKDFFVWGDDTEYSLRLSSKFKCYFVANSVVIHKIAKNSDTSPQIFANDYEEKLKQYYYSFRNWGFISRKYHQRKSNIKRFILLNYNVLFKSESLKFKRLVIIWKGYWAGLFFNPKVEFPQIK